MKKEKLIDLIQDLTGKPIRLSPTKPNEIPIEHRLLDRLLSKKKLTLDWNELNEILLLCNKDRVSEGFFEFFFLKSKARKKKKLGLKGFREGITNFRILAMLAFGNFIFAYRKLSKLTREEIEKELDEHIKNPREIIKSFRYRPTKLLDIKKIGKEDTHLLGYLSEGGIDLDLKTAVEIQKAIELYDVQRKKGKLCNHVVNYINQNRLKYKPEMQKSIKELTSRIVGIYFENNSINTKAFNEFINQSLLEIIKLNDKLLSTRGIGIINTDIYLTWDHIDIYLATSMRRRCEYVTFYNFADSLFKTQRLPSLKLRYFDPTQSYDVSRVDKGLVEGLMLKRAKCTIYLMQETDTLGKDSELASTLAQGKPVVAFIPEINVNKHAKELEKHPVDFFIYKMNLLYETFEKPAVKKDCLKWTKTKKIKITNPIELENFLNDFNDEIAKYVAKRVWNSIETPWAKDADFKEKHLKDFRVFCHFIAIGDKNFYDSRESNLRNKHPLGLQMNLENGVANGVLIVRKIAKCAKLLYNILTKQLEFDIFHDNNIGCWCLKEKITGCIYRVVTDDQKLTNSFWNFYPYNNKSKKEVEQNVKKSTPSTTNWR